MFGPMRSIRFNIKLDHLRSVTIFVMTKNIELSLIYPIKTFPLTLLPKELYHFQ